MVYIPVELEADILSAEHILAQITDETASLTVDF